jgi:hypothetical protein
MQRRDAWNALAAVSDDTKLQLDQRLSAKTHVAHISRKGLAVL